MQTHLDLKSQQSVGVHWGTFQLTSEPILEPVERLAAAVKAQGLDENAFVVLGHGETSDWPVTNSSAKSAVTVLDRSAI